MICDSLTLPCRAPEVYDTSGHVHPPNLLPTTMFAKNFARAVKYFCTHTLAGSSRLKPEPTAVPFCQISSIGGAAAAKDYVARAAPTADAVVSSTYGYAFKLGVLICLTHANYIALFSSEVFSPLFFFFLRR